MPNIKNRVLGRVGARELTAEEVSRVTGSQSTNCTFMQTHRGGVIDDLVDDCTGV